MECVRAYNAASRLHKVFAALLSTNNTIRWHFFSTNTWLSLRLFALGGLISTASCFFCVLAR